MKDHKSQAAAPMTWSMDAGVFEQREDTVLYWLGSAGIYINCRGTRLMADPVIERDPGDPGMSEAGYRFLVPPPLSSAEVPALDAILYTHADYDHLAPSSALGLAHTGAVYYGTAFVRRTLTELGIEESRVRALRAGERFSLPGIRITLTPASHSWQKDWPEFGWCYGPEDCCGFYLETPDGNIWIPGDSILMKEHLRMRDVDLMFLDVSEDPYHFGPEASIRLANQLYPADLLLYHYGTYDAPEKPAFNGDPAIIGDRLKGRERLHILAPGEPFVLRRKQ